MVNLGRRFNSTAALYGRGADGHVLTWQFNDGTANVGADYLAPLDGTLTISSSDANPAPSSRREVRIVPDLLNEIDETFSIVITTFQVMNPQGGPVSGLNLNSGNPGTGLRFHPRL